VLQCVAECCGSYSVMQYVAVCQEAAAAESMEVIATCCDTLYLRPAEDVAVAATRYNTLQQKPAVVQDAAVATHWNTLQHVATCVWRQQSTGCDRS